MNLNLIWPEYDKLNKVLVLSLLAWGSGQLSKPTISLCNYPFVKWEKRGRHGGTYLYPKKVDKIGSSRSPSATYQVWGQFVGYMKPHFKIPKLKTIHEERNQLIQIWSSRSQPWPNHQVITYTYLVKPHTDQQNHPDRRNPSKFKLSICRTRNGNYVMGDLLHSES